jgi:hypothetical protein
MRSNVHAIPWTTALHVLLRFAGVSPCSHGWLENPAPWLGLVQQRSLEHVASETISGLHPDGLITVT